MKKHLFPYGASELKANEGKYKLIAFNISISLFVSLFFIVSLFTTVEKVFEPPLNGTPTITVISTYSFDEELPPVPLDIFRPPVVHAANDAIAGNPVPIPKLTLIDNTEFATLDKIGMALPVTIGNGDYLFIGNNRSGIISPTPETLKVSPTEPTIDANKFFEHAEILPQVDLQVLKSKIIYPELARRTGVEGTVVVKVLVDETGRPVQAIIFSSDNGLLDDAAVEATLKVAYTPAIQNNNPVKCWVMIPINFRLGNN